MQESRLFPLMTAQGLISTLDEMVEAKDFSSYGQLRDVIAKRLLACDNGNPFGAGRKSDITEDDEEAMLRFKYDDHLTVREIANKFGCASSTVSRHLERVILRKQREMRKSKSSGFPK